MEGNNKFREEINEMENKKNEKANETKIFLKDKHK